MPIPKHLPLWKRLRAWLCWANADEGYNIVPLPLRKRIFRCLLYRRPTE